MGGGEGDGQQERQIDGEQLPWLVSAGLKGSFRGRSGISREEEEEEGSGDFNPSINFSIHYRGQRGSRREAEKKEAERRETKVLE